MTDSKPTVRLGVLTNPAAQHNERFPYTHRNLERHLGSIGDAVVTASAAETVDAVRHPQNNHIR